MFDNCLTKEVKSLCQSHLFTFGIMKEENVSIRDFLRNYRKYADKKKIIIVESHGKPEGVYVPYKEWEKKNIQRRITMEDIEKYTFNTGDPQLSQKVDEIVYKYPRHDNT